MNIFILTDSPYLRTGLGRINKNIIRGLSEDHKLVLGCWGWDVNAYPLNDKKQWIYKDDSIDKEFTVFPIRKNPKEQIKTVFEILSVVNCDIILTIGDYWNFPGFEQLKSQLGYSFKWVCYPTIESFPISNNYRDNFKAMDEIISPTKFGQKVIKDSLDIDSTHIPFSIDDTFFKMDDKVIASERKKRNLDGKVRFISVCKNIFRKNIPVFLEALHLANKENSNIVGHLHTNVDKVHAGMYDIQYLINRFELNDILTTPSKRLSNNIFISEEDLNMEYNCSDVFVSTSVAEGYGLPILESQKCGLIPIVPNCSAMSEHIYSGEIVDCVSFFAPDEQEVGIVDPRVLANRMIEVANELSTYDVSENIDHVNGLTSDRMTNSILEVLKSDSGIKFPFDEI
jgi:glycosyltransferase involved in cell wall biosynthesis